MALASIRILRLTVYLKLLFMKSSIKLFAATLALLFTFQNTSAQVTGCDGVITAVANSGDCQTYTIAISGAGPATTSADLTISVANLWHSWASDIDFTIVSSPCGAGAVFQDQGGSADFGGDAAPGETYTFTGGTGVPLDVTAGGTYDPATADFGLTFPCADPNGTWELLICDDAGGDDGEIGEVCVTLPAAIPTMGEWGLACMAIFFLSFGLISIRNEEALQTVEA